MAAIAGELSRQIKGHSEGAQGFRPWWDTVEDNLMYAFVILGLVTLPMTFFSKTPIECTPHPRNFENNITHIHTFTRFFPKVHCTENYIDPFLLYLPFTLLMVPILLTCIEKTYVVLYQVEDKMNKFYLLLVKESLNNEDVAKLAKENVRDCHEIEQAFKASNGCYTSYFYRTLLEILGSLALAVMFSFYSDANGIGVQTFDCMVFTTEWLCIVPNSQFFLYVYVMSLVLIGGYLSCSVYNFLWIVHPRVGLLSTFLDGCQRQTDSYTSNNSTSIESTKKKRSRRKKGRDGPTIRLKLYFKPDARDFNLLINLLAESQGLPEAVRILALFEHQFGMLWEPENVRLMQKLPVSVGVGSPKKSAPKLENGLTKKDEAEKADKEKQDEEKKEDEDGGGSFENLGQDKGRKLQTLVVTWDDADIAEYFYRCYKRRYTLEYSVEISGSQEMEAPIKSILYYHDSSWRQCENMDRLLADSEAVNKEKLLGDDSSLDSSFSSPPRKYNLTFDGLEPGVNYKLTFSTEIDGMTITQTIRNFECEEA